MSKDIVKDLEDLINSGLTKSILPFLQGNRIQIRNFVIKRNDNFYDLINVENNQLVSRLNFKRSAFALANCLIKGNNRRAEIEKIDQEFAHNYNDVIFFEHTLKVSKDAEVRAIRRARLEIAVQQAKFAKVKLDKFIF